MMPAHDPTHGCYRFGPFLADCRKRLLWRDGVVVPLTPKAFELLATLLASRGRLIEKDELVTRVWGNVAVEDATLTRHISTLRKALGERPDQHSYIVTVPGRGYEFVASATELPEGLAPPPTPEPERRPIEPIDHALVRDLEPSRGTRWFPFVLASALAIVIAAAALAALEYRRSQSDTAPRELRQFTFLGGLQRQAAWSPDGRSVAYVSDMAGSSDIWVQPFPDGTPVRVTSSVAEDSQPDWSPDGRWLTFRSERSGGGLYVVPSGGGEERRIADFGYRPKWSPDGALVLFASSGHVGGSSRVYVVGRDGGIPRVLRPDVLGTVDVVDAAWAPDGSGAAIWGRRNDTEWVFLTVPVEQGRPVTFGRAAGVTRRLQDGRLTLGRFVWPRSGPHLFFEGRSDQVRNIWRITIDPATHTWIAGPERLTIHAGENGDMAVSPDGTRIVFSSTTSRTRLWTFPFDALSGRLLGPGEPITSGGAGETDADSPADGTKLVYSAVRGNRQELWERSMVDGHERLLLSTTGWRRTRPRWSRDGLTLAYRRSRLDDGGRPEFAVALLRVGEQERVLTQPGQVNLVPTDWSPDGAWLLGICRIGRVTYLSACILPTAERSTSGASLKVVASDPAKNVFEGRFSPDQHWITFIGVDIADARVSRLYVVPASGGEWRPLTEGLWYDDKPHWSRDGRILYFVSDRGGMFNVWGIRFDGTKGAAVGDPFQITSFTSPRQTISTELPRMQIAVASTQLFLPISETSGELWLLENIQR